MERELLASACIVAIFAIDASATAQGTTSVSCTAIEQVFLSDARAPQYFYLDLPRGAQLDHLHPGTFQARAPNGSSWQTCGAVVNARNKIPRSLGSSPTPQAVKQKAQFKQPCDDLLVTQPVLPLPNGADADDGTIHYVYEFQGITTGGFWGETYLRMTLNYTMPGPVCAVQHSYFVAKGTGNLNLPIDLRVPAGKVIKHEQTFGRIDPPGPAGSHWKSCGRDTGNFPQGQSQYQECASDYAMGLFTEAVANDPVDNAPGRASTCGASGHGGYAMCRVRLEYDP
jgi:hypothetical protein